MARQAPRELARSRQSAGRRSRVEEDQERDTQKPAGRAISQVPRTEWLINKKGGWHLFGEGASHPSREGAVRRRVTAPGWSSFAPARGRRRDRSSSESR